MKFQVFMQENSLRFRTGMSDPAGYVDSAANRAALWDESAFGGKAELQ